MSSLRRGAGALAVLVALAGCDTGDGRTLEPPPPGATAPPLASSTTATTAILGTPPVGSADAAGFVLTSAFPDGGAIDARHTSCDGDNLSPSLSWTGVPAGVVELAVTAVDPDAPGRPLVHWIVSGIDPTVTGFGEGGLPEVAVEVRPWIGPCPPAGETHTYVFTVYALTGQSGIAPGTGVDAAMAALESTPGPTAVVRGTYSRPAGA